MIYIYIFKKGCHGRDRMVVGFTTTYTISAYQYWCEFESWSGRGVQHYVIKVSGILQISTTNKANPLNYSAKVGIKHQSINQFIVYFIFPFRS